LFFIHSKQKKGMSRKIKLTEVAQHDKLEDVWIVIHNKVYDVTHFIGEHPGGDILMDGAGKDATGLFEDIGHSSDARSMLKDYYIGDLVK